MRLKLHAPDQPEIRRLRAHLKRRLELVLSPFGDRIGLVTVWLQDLDGPRGDRRCFLRVKLIRGGDVCSEADASKMTAAIAFSAERLGRAVRRALRLPGAR